MSDGPRRCVVPAAAARRSVGERASPARWRAAVLAGMAAVLVGCASGPRDVASGTAADLKTRSDQTEGERRARVRLELAGAYFAQGKHAIALDEVKLALQSQPDLVDAHNLRGLIYGAMAETGLAEASFRRALQLAPQDGAVMHNYAWFLCQSARHDQAHAMFERALADPRYTDRARTLLAQGVCLVRWQRLPEAQRVLSRAYELDPANPFAGFHLAEVLFLRGEHERAGFYLRRLHAQPGGGSATSLWLAARNAQRLGNPLEARMWGQRLRDRFPQAPETLLFEKGQFDG